jgi:GNAT superfamily N-acetyltransferase
MGFTIDEIAVPPVVTDDWVEMVRVRNEIEADAVGNYDLAFEPAELLPPWQNPHEPKRLLVARVNGRIVARAIYEVENDENPTAWISVEVLTAFRGRRIGGALFDALVTMARDDGKSILQAYVPQAISASTDVIPSPTGFGSVPRDSASTRFLIARGFALEQVERMSRLDLPVPGLDGLLRKATDATGPSYALTYFAGSTPSGYLADIALLRTRMATDAPSAGLEIADSVWTPERVRDEDELLVSSPRTRLTVLAHHESGSIAGFSELSVPPEVHRPVAQEDTIVLSEHRGHRLGMLLKVANIDHLSRVSPGHPSITTFNAEENRFMLSVNEQVGFVAWGYEGAWRAEL